MKKYLSQIGVSFAFLIMGVILMMTAVAFAQTDTTLTSLPVATYDQLVTAFLTQITSWKGATPYVIAAGVVQVVILALETPLGNIAGKYTLLAVLGLSVVSGVIAGVVSGLSFWNSLLSSGVLAAAQVFVYQIYNQFIAKASEPPAAVVAAQQTAVSTGTKS